MNSKYTYFISYFCEGEFCNAIVGSEEAITSSKHIRGLEFKLGLDLKENHDLKEMPDVTIMSFQLINHKGSVQ